MFEILVVLPKSSGKWETSDQRGQAFITMCFMVQISFVILIPLSAGSWRCGPLSLATELRHKEGKKENRGHCHAEVLAADWNSLCSARGSMRTPAVVGARQDEY